MRPELFFKGGGRYRVAESDAPSLYGILQREGIVPKGLRRHKKSGDIRFFLARGSAEAFERIAATVGLDFDAEEVGWPRIWRRSLRAPGVIVGVLLSLLLLLLARAMVWDVRITGTERVEVTEIESALQECGLYRGAFLPALDPDGIALSLRQADARVGYAAVNVKGTVVCVQIRETEPTPSPTPKNPANLVAACDGVITMPLIFEGECLVEAGEVVRAGQILASGVIDTQNHGYRITRAAGQVLARTVHTYTVRIPFSFEKKVYTGEKTYDLSVLFFGRAQKLFKSTSKNIDNCDIIEEIRWIRTPAGAMVPLGYRLKTLAQYRMQTATRSLQQARCLAELELRQRLSVDSAGRTLLEKNMEWCVDAQGVTLICTVVCEEDIARTLEIAQ